MTGESIDLGWFNDKRLIALAIVFAVIVFAWMNRYENLQDGYHRNRITGAVCSPVRDCWFSND